MLQDRIEQLDLRSSQQAHSLDKLTRERLEEERRACQHELENRLQRERHHTQYVVESYGEDLQGQIQGWLEDRLASYGHCLDHHHDDSALPPRHIFTDVHLGPNGGRLFRSRSDETLSVSDYSGKGRKRQFYESRKAAMEQIRGWKVPTGKKDSAGRRRERHSTNNLTNKDGQLQEHNNNHPGNSNKNSTAIPANVTKAEVHKSRDRLADGASPRYEGEGVARQQTPTGRHVAFGADGRQTPSHGAIPKRFPQFHSPPGQSHSYLPTQSLQTRSHGNLSSQPPLGASPTHASHNPASSQPRRGILRSTTDEGALHERAQSSTRQQPNLDGRGLRGDESSPGPNPGGSEGPSAVGLASTRHVQGSGFTPSHQQHNPLYGTHQYVSEEVQRSSAQSGGTAADPQRYRPRTGSVDTLLDGVDGGLGGRYHTRMEGRAQNCVEPAASAGDHSGYVTDSGVRPSYMGRSQPHNHASYRPVTSDRNAGFWPNGSNRSVSDDRSSARYVSGDKHDAPRPVSRDRTSNNVSSYNSPRTMPSERTSGYYTDSEVKRSVSGQYSQSPTPPVHTTQNRQQSQRQPATRYRVLPPLPPSFVPFSDKTKPPVAPKPNSVGSGANQLAWDRTRSQAPASRDVSPNNISSGGLGVRGQNSPNAGFGQNEGNAPSSSQSYNHSAFPPRTNAVHLQGKPPVHRMESPRDQRDAGRQMAEQRNWPAHRSTNAIHNTQQTNGARTQSPYQPQVLNSRNVVSKSENNLIKDLDTSSPREPQSESSGHYSVTNGCLRHDSYSYSPVFNGGSKEDSTCSSNQDSGYSSRMVDSRGMGQGRDGGGGRSGESTTPSSSFSTDRSISLGPPSNASSPYMHMGGNSYGDYVPMGVTSTSQPSQSASGRGKHQDYVNLPSYSDYLKASPRGATDYQSSQQYRPSTTPSSQAGSAGANIQKQVQGWYQRKLLEAAERLRNSEQYGQPADNVYSNYATIPIHYDPVHGSDV